MNRMNRFVISLSFLISSLVITSSFQFHKQIEKTTFHEVGGNEMRLESDTKFSTFHSPSNCTQKRQAVRTFVNRWKRTYKTESFHFTVIDPVTGCTINFKSGFAGNYPMASTVKFDIAVRILQLVEMKKLRYSLVKSDLSKMMRQSDNESAQRLWEIMGGRHGFDLFAKASGLKSTHHGVTWGSALTNSADQGILLTKVFSKKGSLLNLTHQKDLRWLMTHVERTQTWGAGKMSARPLWTTGVKNGWYLTKPGDFGIVNRWRINTLGAIWDADSNPRLIFTGYSNTWRTDTDGKSAWTELAKKSAEIFLKMDLPLAG